MTRRKAVKKLLEVSIQNFDLKGQMISTFEEDKLLKINKLGILPQDKLIAEVGRKRKGFYQAYPKEILQKSPLAVEAKCRYFGECGGCRLQNLDYEKQVFYKWQALRNLLDESGFANLKLEEFILAENIFYYRNKMEFSFSPYKWYSEKPEELPENDFALGFHAPSSFKKVLDLEECHLQSLESTEILKVVRKFALEKNLRPYDFEKHTGTLQFLIIKEGKFTKERLVNLVTSPIESEIFQELAERIAQAVPSTTGILHSINETLSSAANLSRTTLLKGKETIFEQIGDFKFKISASSFFQANTEQTKKLYSAIAEFGNFTGKEKVLDLYCGAGTISIFIAKLVERVIGIEIIPEAVEDAKFNAKLNGITNCDFFKGDVKDKLGERILKIADVLILDPPRAGMHPKVLEKILSVKPKKIIYVSCNPKSFVQDLKSISQFYTVERMLPFDLFPHTPHSELLVELKIKN
ncbi:MAG: 23S rRNA (uracil(1939)-C(5))-methyltransferase RlmD [Calditrichaeota bacterium]|nr:MAG: 23S rRNA (uracil(1939)-C(5))-methyltransferase RlmD [Calditrichota bacterium]